MRVLKGFALLGISALLLVMLALAAPVALAQEVGGVIVGGNRVIEAGEVYKGDLAILGGNLIIRQGGRVEGDIAVFGGNVDVYGTIQGDVVSFGGNIRLRETGVLEGNLTRFGGNVNRDPGSTLKGQSIVPNRAPAIPAPPQPPAVPSLPQAPAIPAPPVAPTIQVQTRNAIADFVGWLVGTAVTSIGLGVLAVLALLLLPNQLHTVADTMRRNPAASAGMGALTWLVWIISIPLIVVVSLLLLVICIGLLGIPILAVLMIGLPLAALLGWLATGMIVGDALMRGLRIQSHVPLVSIAIGVMLITGVYHVVDRIPCLGGPLAWLLTLPGLGAVILSWFGTRSWTPGDPYLPGRFGSGPFRPTSPAPGWTPPLGTGSWSGTSSERPAASAATGLVASNDAGASMLAAGAAVSSAARAAAADFPPATTNDLLGRMAMDADDGDDELSRDDAVWLEATNPAATASQTTVSAAPLPDTPRDNLRVIPGIGPVYAALFYDRGITSYAQLADLTSGEVSDILTGDRVIPVTDDEAHAMIAEARRLVNRD